MRGRLIFPLFAEIYRLDRPAMALWGTIDPDFREPILVESQDQNRNVGEQVRIEMPVVSIPCQVENWRVAAEMAASSCPGRGGSENLALSVILTEPTGLLAIH